MGGNGIRQRLAKLGVAAVAVVALGVAGCGTETIDADDLEGQLAEQLAPQGGVEPEDISVDCPDDEESEQGNTFECTLTAPNGDEVPVSVEITNDDGGFEAEVLPASEN